MNVTYQSLMSYLNSFGYEPTGDFIVCFEQLAIQWEATDEGVVDHGGALGGVWHGSELTADSKSKLIVCPAVTRQILGNEDDCIMVVEGTSVGAVMGKVNADRPSMKSRGSAQNAYGPTTYKVSKSDKLGDVLRPTNNITYYDINMDRNLTLQEVAEGRVKRDNTTMLGHPMGLSEGCWGPLGGRKSLGWAKIWSLAKKHGGLDVFLLYGPDFYSTSISRVLRPFLHVGQRAPLVRKLQHGLSSSGFHAKVDGDFGPQTAKALLSFRQSYPNNDPFSNIGCTMTDWRNLNV
jgi:hypothetical protein